MEQKLTKKEFDVLVSIAESEVILSQRDIELKTGVSLSTVNRIIKDLAEKGYISDGDITELGKDILKEYEVKRAIFIAAGFGSRLVPVTLNTPKPLVRVNGIRIIDTLIDSCLNIGINEIYVVRGYLAEQFDQLLYKYPMIKFIENPLYNEANNISSAMTVRFLLENAYVFESDLLMYNKTVIKKYHYQSDFLAFPVERTDDWCFESKDGIITEEKIGGLNCHQMVGISYWNFEDGKKLSVHIKEAYEMPGGKERYWEQVPLVVFKNQYNVAICECKSNDIKEIDTFKELKDIDKTYDV